MPSAYKICIWTFALLVTAFPAISQAESGPRIALYDGNGTWGPGMRHLKRYLQSRHVEFTVVGPTDIQKGALDQNTFSALIMPGGKSWEYLNQLGTTGAEKIRGFVERGGGYVGICAGGFYATRKREGPSPIPNTTGNREESAIYEYGIGLIDAVAVDGANITRYHDEFRNGVRTFELIPATPAPSATLLTQSAPERNRTLATAASALYAEKKLHALFLEGSGWKISEDVRKKQNVDVLARFPASQLPAMLSFTRGQGRVFLTGPHLEIEEKRLFLGLIFQDPETDWPVLDHALQFVARGSTTTAQELHQAIAP